MAKADQVGIFEKHAEKIAIALALVIFLALMFLRVVSSPNASDKIGYSLDKIPPSQMDQVLEEAARQAENSIRNKRPEQKTPDDPLAKLQEVMREPLHIAVSKIAPPTVPWEIRKRVPGPVGGQTVPDVPEPPAPEKTLVWAGRELVKTADATVESRMAAHVTSVLDYARMINSWKQAVKESGAAMRVLFLDAVAERQIMNPDGTWGEIESLAPSNAGVEIPDLSQADRAAIEQAFQSLSEPGRQRSILNPTYEQVFWPLAGTWGGWMHHLPRTEVSDQEDAKLWPDWPDQQQADPMRMRLAASKLAAARELRDAGAPGVRPTVPTAAPGGMGAAPGGGRDREALFANMGAPGGAAAPTGPTVSVPTPGADDRQREMDQRRATLAVEGGRELIAQGRELLKQGKSKEAVALFRQAERKFETAMNISESIVGASEGLNEAVNARYAAELPQPTPLPSLAEMCRTGKVQFWYHDTSCKQGVTYRYRLKLRVLNPVFDAGMIGRPDAPQPVMEMVSPWSDEVKVSSMDHFFLTGADRDGNAKITVFKSEQGLLLAQRATVAPGDVIGTVESRQYINPLTATLAAEPMDVDFSTGYVVVSIDTETPILPRGAVGINRKTVSVTLLSPEGRLITRNIVDDKDKESFSELSRTNKSDEDYISDAAGRSY